MTSGSQLANADIATRVGTMTVTSDSSASTGSDVLVGTVSAFLESGKKYALYATAALSSSGANDAGVIIIREDGISGTQLAARQVAIPGTGSTGYGVTAYGEYTAGATGSKTFALTQRRTGSAGNVIARAGATTPTYLTVTLLPT